MAKFVTSQDESSRVLGYKKYAPWKKHWEREEMYQLGKQANWNFMSPGDRGKNHSTNTIFRPKRMARC